MRVPYRKPGKYTNIKQDPVITQQMFLQLKEKLEKLVQKTRPQAIAEMNRLAQLGDFSENAEYQIAKGRLRGINNRIDTLEHQIKHAEIITPSKTDTISVGHTVTLKSFGKTLSYTILGSSETDPQKGVISRHSPLGQVLIGKQVGDIVSIIAGKKKIEYEIKKIV